MVPGMDRVDSVKAVFVSIYDIFYVLPLEVETYVCMHFVFRFLMGHRGTDMIICDSHI